MRAWLGYTVRRRLLDADLGRIRSEFSGRVLEVGNGPLRRAGRFQPPMEQVQSWTYLDLNPEVRPNIVAELEHLPVKDAACDTVVCLEVLEYVDHPRRGLEEMARVLRPGGSLVLTVPFLHRADTPHDYWRFSEHALRPMLTKAGFDVRWLSTQGAALAVAANILKFTVAAIPNRRCRQCVGLAMYVPLTLLVRLDQWSSRLLPVLRTFSTGYLVLAVRRSGGPACRPGGVDLG